MTQHSLSALTALSPLDGRYAAKVAPLRPLLSEYGLVGWLFLGGLAAWYLFIEPAGSGLLPKDQVSIKFGSSGDIKVFTLSGPSGQGHETVFADIVAEALGLASEAIEVRAGIEKRVGSTRVVGVYGAELNIGFGNGKTTFEYGNALSNTNAGPRTTESKQGGTFGIGLNGFAGIEWFAAPKLSLSGEYAWGLAMQSTGLGSTTTESFVNNSTTSTTVDGTPNDGQADKTSSFKIDTGVSGARIAVNFYFQ